MYTLSFLLFTFTVVQEMKVKKKPRLNYRIARPKSTASTQFLILGELFLAADNPTNVFLNQGILTKDD